MEGSADSAPPLLPRPPSHGVLEVLNWHRKLQGRSRKGMARGCFGMKVDRIGVISGSRDTAAVQCSSSAWNGSESPPPHTNPLRPPAQRDPPPPATRPSSGSFSIMSAVQRMKVANEKHSKTITQRGHVQKTTPSSRSSRASGRECERRLKPLALIFHGDASFFGSSVSFCLQLISVLSVCVCVCFQRLDRLKHDRVLILLCVGCSSGRSDFSFIVQFPLICVVFNVCFHQKC
ncbi:unnamed protein product [Leuciscus chuanchicus]